MKHASVFEEDTWPLPRIMIDLPSWQAIMEYTSQCNVEINGFGLVDYDRQANTIMISDVFITQQEAAMSGVEIDDADLHRHMYGLRQEGTDPGRVRFQWHSHVHMPVYFSDVDTKNIDRWSGEFLVSLVVNKHGEWRCRLDLYKPLRLSFDVPIEIVWPSADEDLRKQVKTQMKEKVKYKGSPKWLGGLKVAR